MRLEKHAVPVSHRRLYDQIRQPCLDLGVDVKFGLLNAYEAIFAIKEGDDDGQYLGNTSSNVLWSKQ